MEQIGHHWKDFHEIFYFIIYRKCVEEIRFPLNPDKKNGLFT